VTLTLRRPSNVQLICLVDGYAESWPLYEKNSRVRLLQVHTDAGTRASLLRDAGSPEHPAVYQQLNAPKGKTSTVTLTILSAYSAQLDVATGPRGYADTSISEIEVWSSS
jgi:hypothetical protein